MLKSVGVHGAQSVGTWRIGAGSIPAPATNLINGILILTALAARHGEMASIRINSGAEQDGEER